MKRLSVLRRRLRGWMIRLMPGVPTCQEVDSYLDDYLDGELPDRQRRRFERHLRVCASCQRYLRGYTRAVRAAREAGRENIREALGPPPEELVQSIMIARTKSANDG